MSSTSTLRARIAARRNYRAFERALAKATSPAAARDLQAIYRSQ